AKMESDEEKNFFKFLSGHEAENSFTKSIEEKVNFAKQNLAASFYVFPQNGKWEPCDQVQFST
ncbi:MAG: hypothetical protein II584_01910, partial [Treponema sp.]|nr:hypothetical protein [Treponema sp.]